MLQVLSHLSGLADPRAANARHGLPEIMCIAIAAKPAEDLVRVDVVLARIFAEELVRITKLVERSGARPTEAKWADRCYVRLAISPGVNMRAMSSVAPVAARYPVPTRISAAAK